jgi:hypothetical protein
MASEWHNTLFRITVTIARVFTENFGSRRLAIFAITPGIDAIEMAEWRTQNRILFADMRVCSENFGSVRLARFGITPG